MNKDLKETLRSPFEDIFDTPDKLQSDEAISNLMKGSVQKSTPRKNDYLAKRVSLHEKAKKTINALFKFYLAEDIINSDEYLVQKAYHEQCTLGDLMTQIEISNTAIVTIMEAIELGDLQPRMFEVLSEMMRSNMELLKMKSMTMINMEENMKQLISDRQIYHSEAPGKLTEGGGLKSRGSKDLIRNLRNIIDDDIEDATIDN